MKPIISFTLFTHFFSVPVMSMLVAALALSLGGCTTMSPSESPEAGSPVTEAAIAEPEPIPVVRYGRYTLVEVISRGNVYDLLKQIVDVTIPRTVGKQPTTVGDGMRYVLLHSGYRLCTGESSAAFDRLPLPAAHSHLGPMALRDALMVLAGPVWALQVDEAQRTVCFEAVSPSVHEIVMEEQ